MQRVIAVAYRGWSLAKVELQEVSYEEKWGHISFFFFPFSLQMRIPLLIRTIQLGHFFLK